VTHICTRAVVAMYRNFILKYLIDASLSHLHGSMHISAEFSTVRMRSVSILICNDGFTLVLLVLMIICSVPLTEETISL
jgi:hypothetical protein